MVHELHKAGYQRLRIAPGVSSSGCHWRCAITYASNVKANGWEPVDLVNDVASYTSAAEDRYFDWSDGCGKNARQLAQLFVERFPSLCERGFGVDTLYAGWFVQMLGAAERGRLPVFYADYELELTAGEQPPPPSLSVDWAGTPAIRTSGGVSVRIVEALNGYRTKYGRWPEVLECEPELIAMLATSCLSPLGFYMLQSKVRLVQGSRTTLVAKGNGGEVFDYGGEGWQSESGHQHDAREWLGWEQF